MFFLTHLKRSHPQVTLRVTSPQIKLFEVRHHAKVTVGDRMTCNLQLAMMVWIPTTCRSRIFYIDGLRSGHFRDHRIKWQGEKSSISKTRQIHSNHSQTRHIGI